MRLIKINYQNFNQLHTVSTTDINKLVAEYSTVFGQSELGRLPGEVHFYTDEGAKPKQCPADGHQSQLNHNYRLNCQTSFKKLCSQISV